MARVMVAVLAGVGAALAGGSAALAQAHGDGGDVAVTIVDNSFSPSPITVDAGGTVTWTNADARAHDVAGGGFASPRLESGATWSHRFTEAGSYAYLCSLHPEMVGTVVVAEHAEAAPVATATVAPDTTEDATVSTELTAAAVPDPGVVAVPAAPHAPAASSLATATTVPRGPVAAVAAAQAPRRLHVEPGLVLGAIVAAAVVAAALHVGPGRGRAA